METSAGERRGRDLHWQRRGGAAEKASGRPSSQTRLPLPRHGGWGRCRRGDVCRRWPDEACPPGEGDQVAQLRQPAVLVDQIPPNSTNSGLVAATISLNDRKAIRFCAAGSEGRSCRARERAIQLGQRDHLAAHLGRVADSNFNPPGKSHLFDPPRAKMRSCQQTAYAAAPVAAGSHSTSGHNAERSHQQKTAWVHNANGQ